MIPSDQIPATILANANFPLWSIVIKSTLAVAMAALACALLQRHSAAVRHRVWVFGLTASLIVPVVSLLLPQLTLEVLPSAMTATKRAAAPEVWPPSPAAAADLTWDRSTGESRTNSLRPHSMPSGQVSDSIPADPRASRPRSEKFPLAFATRFGFEQALLSCWMTGSAIGLSWFLISLTRQSLRLSRLRSIEDDHWATSVTTAADMLGLRRPIVTLAADGPCVPAVFGVLRPRLLIPRDWRTWTPTQRNCILLHELAHVKRRDVLTQLLGRIALVAYWFNPLIWRAVKQLRIERELASDDCVLLTGQKASDYAEQLLRTLRAHRVTPAALGVAMAQSARLDRRILAILDPQVRRDPVGSRFAVILPCLVGVICMGLGGITLSTQLALANPLAESDTLAEGNPVWKENYTVQYPGTLPVSVAFSANGEVLLAGDTSGEVMALIFARDEARWRWKSNVGGAHAAVVFSADQKKVYATTENGVRILDVERGREEDRVEVQDSHPIAIGVFPDKPIDDEFTRLQIVFGNPRGYFVKSWVHGKLAETLGSIETSTVASGAEPPGEGAVPLAVDPNGRSAIMTGPVDPTGEAGGVKGKNVLWAYVCGDYAEGSPGNRLLLGHTATVVSAAWAAAGGTAVTGDADGRVIMWDAKTMQETARLELGGRIAALAISQDGNRIAAYALGRLGQVFVWETDSPKETLQPIHAELGDFGGATAYASLSFSPDGRRLAGCAADKRWLTRTGELIGNVRVWELSAAPRAQLPPHPLYTRTLPPGSSADFVVLNNHSILMPADKEGAIDFRSIADGSIQQRLTLGEFTIGSMQLSADKTRLAIAQQALIPPGNTLGPSTEWDVTVWDFWAMKQLATIRSCSRILHIAPAGEVIAVVREKRIELWDVASATLLQAAPFNYTRIDAARFSPDGKLLAISDRNDLVLWRWKEDAHERIPLGRSVGSLAYSPEGRFLAEGPAPREDIQIRDIETGNVVQTLSNASGRSMNVPQLAYAQGGRVLIACDNITFSPEVAVPHRIHIWDLSDGSIAHELAVPAGLPQALEVSPNGRYLVTILEDSDGRKLSVWRLDGQPRLDEPGPKPPAAIQPQ